MGSAVLQDVRFADVQELLLHTSKRSDVDCSELKACQYSDCHQSLIQSAKYSDMGSAYTKRLIF